MVSIDSSGKKRNPRLRSAQAKLAMAVLLGLGVAGRCGGGVVATDGSVGRAMNLAGPHFAVTPDLGKQVGGNLFHSFTTFNLDHGDVATFSGPGNVANVISRVTGGTASSIDGTIQCTIPNAHFFLINPAGVVFGPNAALDVKGSFVVSTADYLKGSDGSHFNATNLADTMLTSAAPAAFGFLAAHPAPILMNRANLAVTAGNTISVVGGDVQMANAILAAPGGRINVLSAASAGELAFDPISATADISLPAGSITFGDVSINSNFSGLNTSGDGGGKVSLRANTLEMNSALIFASNSGSSNAPGIDIVLTGDATLVASVIATGSTSTGASGPINISAAALSIDGTGQAQLGTGLSASANAAGRAGDINISATSFSLTGGSAIFANTLGTGNGGTVTIAATGDLRIDGLNGSSTGIYLNSRAAGNAGNAVLSGTTVELADGGSVFSEAFDAGNAGNIFIAAGTIAIDNLQGSTGTHGVAADAFPATATGARGGQITLQADTITVLAGVQISASTAADGSAGSVILKGGAITLDGRDSPFTTGIFATSLNPDAGGAGGSITLTGASLTILGGAVASVSSNSSIGAAGSIAINISSSLTIDNQQLTDTPQAGTGLFASANNSNGTAGAGTLSVQADTVSILGGGAMSASAFGAGSAGTISVTAGASLTIDAQNGGLVTGIFANGTNGTGGSVTVLAPTVSLLSGGLISVSSFGSGNAGAIAVSASQSLTLDAKDGFNETGFFANNTDGAGGSIRIAGGDISILGGGSIAAGSSGAGNAGAMTFTGNTFTIEDPGGGGSLVGADTLGSGSAGTISIAVKALIINGAGSIGVGTSGIGAGGTITVSANSVTLNGKGSSASLDAITIGAGSAGTINVNTATLQILDGALITAGTQSDGHGGVINVTADTILMNDLNAANRGGIFAESVVPTGSATTGDAGTIHVQANALTILNGSAIGTTTAGTGSGGMVTVAVNGPLLIDSQNAVFVTGILATSLASGAAGGVNVTADSILLRNGGNITSNSNADGPGGTVAVQARSIQITSNGVISSNAKATGNAGTVSVQAGSLQISDGGGINSNSNGTGNGGNVSVTVIGGLTISGVSLDNVTGITGNSYVSSGNGGNVDVTAGSIVLRNTASITSDTYFQGAGGNVSVNADSISVQTNSLISSGTFGTGNGGNVTVSGRHISLDATSATIFTGITAQTQGDGNAGNIDLTAERLSIVNNGEVNSTSFAAGAGGKVTIKANDIHMRNREFKGNPDIDSASSSTGPAGTIELHIANSLIMAHTQISSNSNHVSGGGVKIFAGGSIVLRNSAITAAAADAGGTVVLNCPGTIYLQHSAIATRAGGNGGNMVIDPSVVVLDRTLLTANGGNNGGNITIQPDFFLQSRSIITATGSTGVSGRVDVTSVLDLTGALLSLPVVPTDNVSLQPQCAADLAGNTSSFIVTGRGGEPLSPGGYAPAGELRLPGKKQR